jgi:3-isopropylmalate dehydrogenase
VSETHSIGVIRGDGIGPEVVREGLKVLERISELYGFSYRLTEYPWSSQLYLDTGQLMPVSILDEYRNLDALYLGALGDPRVERGLVEHSVIMAIRLHLDLYINLRPVVLYSEHLTPLKNVKPDDVNFIVVRENTEDAYVGIGGVLKQGSADEVAIAEMVYTRRGVERTIRYAFELAKSRSKRRLTLVDKSNAIRPQEIWRRIFSEIAGQYPEVGTDAIYVDTAAMFLVTDPSRFDVIVTTNLFGDILTDLGAAIQGGMGGAASANINPGQVSMFEPIHGSAPDIAGKNSASPIGAILALSMMLDYLGERSSATLIESAVRQLLQNRRVSSLDASSGLHTQEIGDLVIDEITRLGREPSLAESRQPVP